MSEKLDRAAARVRCAGQDRHDAGRALMHDLPCALAELDAADAEIASLKQENSEMAQMLAEPSENQELKAEIARLRASLKSIVEDADPWDARDLARAALAGEKIADPKDVLIAKLAGALRDALPFTRKGLPGDRVRSAARAALAKVPE